MSLQSLVTTVATYWQRVQTTLFPYLETAGVSLTPELERLVAILDLLRIEEALPPRHAHPVGAPPQDRAPLARAFLVKHYLNLPGTKALRERLRTDDTLRRICGWESEQALPSESTFGNAGQLPEVIAELSKMMFATKELTGPTSKSR